MAEPTLQLFVIGAWLLAGIVVVLTRISSPDESGGGRTRSEADTGSIATSDPGPTPHHGDTDPETASDGSVPGHDGLSVEGLSTELLLANAVVTHGTVLVLVVLGVILSGVSMDVLGVDSFTADQISVWTGLAAGVALYVVDEALSEAMTHVGLESADLLRSALAPSSLRGWCLLLLGILPLVSVAEELLFRGALIGATLALGLSPLAVLLTSAVLFGFAHGIQGVGGVVVAGFLGLGLGVVFIWTGSLLAVVIAHYVVNALEFLVHEGLT